MKLVERKEQAKKLAATLHVEVQTSEGGRTFKFSEQIETLDPRTAVQRLKQLQNAIELEGWTVVSARTPKPHNDEGRTTIVVYAQYGAKCRWPDCHFAALSNEKYCHRHKSIAAQQIPPVADRRTARPQGMTRAEGLARLGREKKK